MLATTNTTAVRSGLASWEARAACRNTPAGEFFPPLWGEEVTARREREHAAKRVCTTCVVRDDCRDYALRTGQLLGVWGGLSEAERRVRVFGS